MPGACALPATCPELPTLGVPHLGTPAKTVKLRLEQEFCILFSPYTMCDYGQTYFYGAVCFHWGEKHLHSYRSLENLIYTYNEIILF